jgi:ubiquinone/menaquinone biosynthesis C-methylase UbiE
MIGKHAEKRPGMTWLEMDIRDLKFEDEAFDVVIDKVSLRDCCSSSSDRRGDGFRC